MKDFLILGKDSTLAGFFLKKYRDKCKALNKTECDITNAKSLEEVLKNGVFKYVINCAAITDIKYCEANPVECFRVNTIAVNKLSRLCRKYNKKLIHFSSDYAVKPVNVYGYSKFLSENIIDMNQDLVIRTSFYSQNYYLIKSLMDGSKTNAYKNMFFNPVSVTRLTNEIYKNRDRIGILNIFSNKKISKYDFGKKVVSAFGINKKLIHPIDYINKQREVVLPLNSFVKSDIKISLTEDLEAFEKAI